MLEPAVDGVVTRTGPSTLAFVPDEPFAPGTTYQATLVQVNVIYGAGPGLTATDNQFWHQDTAGVLGAVEAGDAFGAALPGSGER